MSVSRQIPTARRLPLIGSLPHLVQDPLGFCTRAATEADGIVRIPIGPAAVYLITHPEYVRHVSAVNARNYVKGRIMDGIRIALGEGLFTNNGESWKRQRRLMQPAFHAEHIRRVADLTTRITHEHLEQWRPAIDLGETIDVVGEAIRLNIEIVHGALFANEVDHEHSTRLLTLTNAVFSGMARQVWGFFLPSWVPVPGAATYRRSIAQLDTQIFALIESRRTRGTADGGDLLGMFVHARDEHTSLGMSDQQIRDEIFTLFLAGYESTATTIAWSLYLLSQHPSSLAKLREEVDEVLKGEAAAFDDLSRLRYTRSVISETLRLYPSFPLYFRSSVDADRLGPYTLPANAQILLCPFATHRDPRFWDDPDSFDPTRFDEDRFGRQARRAYYPFGMGARICIGESLALMIAQLVVSTLVQRFDLAIPPGLSVKPRYAMTYQPKNGLPLLFTPRAGQAS